MHSEKKGIYIGLMSGTSMDAIDAALVRFEETGAELIETHSHLWPQSLRRQLQALSTSGDDEINQLGQADARAGDEFAAAALELLAKTGIAATEVTAIGSHGQTIRHGPDAEAAFTLQIGDPNRIAEQTGITTVADFRRRDMAAGGEGAPLAPAFHADQFGGTDLFRCILNIGGIANITLLPPADKTAAIGFDTGPGNCLLDAWADRHLHQPYDKNGCWAAGGKIQQELLTTLLDDAYFHRTPPKSTGVEYFNLCRLEKQLRPYSAISPQDIQATLVALSANSIADAIVQAAPGCHEVLVCGGGTHNRSLMVQLKHQLPQCKVESTAAFGIDPDWVEAMAFAWLARRTLLGLSGNLPAVTGAKHAVVLGGIYPANPR